ncbi:sialidase family protein [soil metagenome]
MSGLSTLPAGCGVVNPSATLVLNSEVQPMVVADPNNPFHLVATLQQDRWSKFGGNAVVTYISDDYGFHWRPAHHQPKFTHCAGGTSHNGGDYEVATDSWLSIGPDGTVFQVVFAINQVATYTTAITVSRSTDGGDTWSNPSTLIADTDSRFFDDRPTVTADPQHPGRVYVAWDRIDDTSTDTVEHYQQPFYLSRSLDNGVTWESPRNVLDTPVNSGTIGHQILVLDDGTLIDAFDLLDDSSNTFEVTRSTNGGQSWSAPIRVAPLPDGWNIPNPKTGTVGIRAAALPLLALGRDGKTVFATFPLQTPNGQQHVGFTRSVDHGLTWSTPIVVDHTPVGQSAFLPVIAVTEDGRIGITHYDTRNDTTTNPATLAADVWLTSCWSNCTQVTSWTELHVAGGIDVLRAPKTGLGYMLGDYTGLVGGLFGSFVAVFDKTHPDQNNAQDVVSAILR